MKKTLSAVLIIAAMMAQGCTVAQVAGNATDRYCSLPEEARAANREAVALATAPNRIYIQCHGDRRALFQ